LRALMPFLKPVKVPITQDAPVSSAS